ncbi:MAG: glycosyltransferase [Chloroflexi bacterium]|nr:glycosyltransferase [Chloroflexota bacterium]
MGAVRLIVETATTSPPRFSIVVPAYQAASTLGETLDAVLAQTFADWECIVVDDGSKDETLRIATSYAQRDPRIHAIHQDNAGTAGAYNTGVGAAAGLYVVICSADDILLPEHLSEVSAFIEREPGYDIYSTSGYFWWPGDYQELCDGPWEGADVRSLQLSEVIRCCFYSVGAAYRRDLFASVGGYRAGTFGEDYDFWLRAMAMGARHRYLPKPLSLFRRTGSQKSARLETAYRSDIRLVSDLRRDFELSAAEGDAVTHRIRELELKIDELRRPSAKIRRTIRQSVVRVLGHRRAKRLARTAKVTLAALSHRVGRAPSEDVEA